MAEKLNSHLKKAELDFEIRASVENESEMFYLFTDQDHAQQVLDIFRVLMGLGGASKPSEADEEWMQVGKLPIGVVGKFSIIISIFLFVLYANGSTKESTTIFFISLSKNQFLPEILNGEVWRLITPVFMHFSFMHILFNCMWMSQLSRILEDYYSTQRIIFYFVFLGVTSNIAQYLMKGPMFGGLSGIVYGLLGLLWVKKSVDPEFPFMLPKRDIYLMIGWFFLCLTGVLGNIANTAHGIGLAVGMAIALIENFEIIKGPRAMLKWSAYIFGILFATMLAEVAWSVFAKQPLYYKLLL